MRADARRPRAHLWRLGIAAAVWLAVVAPARSQSPADIDAAVAAATHAVQDAFGGDADVSISTPVLSIVDDAARIGRAVAEPASRTAGPVRFVLYAAGDGVTPRLGRLTARVDVRAPHLRARQRVAARAAITSDDVEVVRGDIGRQTFAALPTITSLSGAVTRKALMPDEVVGPLDLVTRSLVTSGEEVVTVARVGSVEVQGRAIAAQSGKLGETVIVVNPDSRKRLRARVVADARVEVILGT